MIIPFLIILVCVALVAGDEDSSSASGAARSDGIATSADESADGSGAGETAASEVGKTKPKIEFSPGSEPRGLETRDLVVGNGAEATPGAEVTVQYIIVLNKSGKEVESSWEREPYSFPLGSGRVTPGWEQGIKGMKEGGRRELVSPSELAYGKAGSQPGIGPNEDLRYVIDLLEVKPPASVPGQALQP